FPCSERVARRRLGTKLGLERAHLVGGLRELVLEPAGLPDLKLVAEADEGHRLGDTRMTFETVAQHDPPLAVDLERLAGAIECQGELLVLVGERSETRD